MSDSLAEIPTASAAMLAICEELDCAARSDTQVLITAAGSGREALARFIHQASARHPGPFVQVDCAASATRDLETTLFGNMALEGLLLTADGGTLLLRNVGEMNRSVQDRLLKFLDDSDSSVHGTDGPARTSVRLISATDSNLHNEMLAGRFSEGLYYRLNVIHIIVPPVEEQGDDLRQLLAGRTPSARLETPAHLGPVACK